MHRDLMSVRVVTFAITPKRHEVAPCFISQPKAPGGFHAAALLALSLHIAGGITGILSGTAAMIFRKGGRLHRAAGQVFVASMLVMAAFGAIMATFLSQWTNVMGGTFTLYLIASAWTTARRKTGGTGTFEVTAMLAALGVAAGAVWLVRVGVHRPDGLINGQPWQPALVFAVIATLAATMAFRVILHGGISGVPRIARHLWRMCLGLFIAAGSFFLGQQQVIPFSSRLPRCSLSRPWRLCCC